MPIQLKNKNFAISQLASAISDSATSLSVLSGKGSLFPAAGPFRAVIWSSSYDTPVKDANREIVTLELSSGDTFTATRAQESTTARSWSANSYIAHVITAGKIEELEAEINAKVDKVGGATAGNLASFASGGGIQDSGVAASTVGTKIDKVPAATIGNLASFASGGGVADSGVAASAVVTDVSGKADKVGGATSGNLASLNSSGNLQDSGVAASTVGAKADKVAGTPTNKIAKLDSSGNLAATSFVDSDVVVKSGTPATGDGLFFNGSLWVPTPFPMQNLLWQGSFDLFQSATSFSSLNANAALNDGFRMIRDNTPAAYTMIRDAPASGLGQPFQYVSKWTVSTADASPPASAYQVYAALVEGYDLLPLRCGLSSARPSTISFWVYADHSATYGFFVHLMNASSQAILRATFSVSSGWQQVVVSIPALTSFVPYTGAVRAAIVGFVLMAGSDYQSSTVGSWDTTNPGKWGVTGQSNFASATGRNLQFTGLQWTPGSVTVPYLHLPLSEIVAKAQRYYEKSYDIDVAPGSTSSNGRVYTSGAAGSTTTIDAGTYLRFAVRKRAAPTMTLHHPTTGTSGQWLGGNAASLQTANAASYLTGESGFSVYLTGLTGLTTGYAYSMSGHWVADARML
jgi:hypothetical protein